MSQSESRPSLKSLLSWGSLLSHFVIAVVSIETIWVMLHVMDVVGSWLEFLHVLTFVYLTWKTEVEFVSSILVGPGYIEKGWKPPLEVRRFMPYCEKCDGYKAPRSHHCSKCNRCVMKMDHHCPFINTCVGHYNHAHFIKFLIAALMGCVLSGFILSHVIYGYLSLIYHRIHYEYYAYHLFFSTDGYIQLGRALNNPSYFLALIFAWGLSVGTGVCLVALLLYQIKSVYKNMTPLEEHIVERSVVQVDMRTGKATYTRKDWQYPYNLGTRENFKQVLWNWRVAPLGNGYEWKTCNGLSQYHMSLEQVRQRKLRRLFTRKYICRWSYNGWFFPILSQGFMTAICFPWTDDKRIKIEEGDIISVTAFSTLWYYGAILDEMGETDIKGWFPKNCVEIYRSGDYEKPTTSSVRPPAYSEHKIRKRRL